MEMDIQEHKKQQKQLLKLAKLEDTDDIDLTVKEITSKIKNIHTGYLFLNKGRNVLREICLNLSAQKSNIHLYGWKNFALELDIATNVINVIENNTPIKEDVTYNVLAHFVQRDDASMDKIVIALRKIERFDIITRLKNILINFGNELNDYYKITDNGLLKPNKKIPVPLVLTQPDLDETVFKKPNRTGKYPKIVLFTYATESEELAYQLAKTLRTKGIGVIILEEHKELLIKYADKFVFDAIIQSDYVIPILTVDYLNIITSLSDLRDYSQWENVDNTYVKYIYKMLVTNFIKNSCYNNKIRCIIPQSVIPDVLKHDAMKYKTELSVWRSSEEIDLMGDLIISNRY